MGFKELTPNHSKTRDQVRLGVYQNKKYKQAVLAIGGTITNRLGFENGTKVKLFYDRSKKQIKIIKDSSGRFKVYKDSIFNKGTRLFLNGTYLNLSCRKSTPIEFNLVDNNILIVILPKGG